MTQLPPQMKSLHRLISFAVALPALVAVSACAEEPDTVDAQRLENAQNVDFRAAGSCDVDDCGTYVSGNSCQCDELCTFYGDCCDDVESVCSDPNECEANEDCDVGFCGWDDNNDRVCKDWAVEGESCQGFVIPSARAFCDPSLECVQVEPTFDVPGICTAPVDPNECENNDDCDDGFCGWNSDNDRVCKPWAQIGDSCEGFVIPEARAFCAPGLLCEQNDATGDIPGTCVFTPNECETTEDCDDGFCGWDTNGDRICKAWAQEGDTCGGFVPPEALSLCEPGLECDTPANLPDAQGECVTPLPAGESCEESCGGQAASGCYCDSLCSFYGDCCEDKVAVCG